MQNCGEPFKFRLDKLDSQEGRDKFKDQMDKIGIGHLELTKQLSELDADASLKRLLMCPTKCIVRVYMISGYDLASRDNGSFSDPYLIMQLGKKKVNERDNYILDEPNPGFYKSYDFEATFPGCAPLAIHAMDYDEVFGDDLIGTTKVDLEDRFFSTEW